jgi:hypothetical protein
MMGIISQPTEYDVPLLIAERRDPQYPIDELFLVDPVRVTVATTLFVFSEAGANLRQSRNEAAEAVPFFTDMSRAP